MSWLKEASGGEAPPPYKEDPAQVKVKDPYIPNRMVADKPANRPFLAYRDYRLKQEALHAEWLKKKEERDEKIARGEKVGPLEPDPTEQKEVGLLGFLKFILFLLVAISLAGKFVTGSFTWDYETKWLQIKPWLPRNELLFSESYLETFKGEEPGQRIYIAIDGDVYDVSAGSAYQPGGSYHILAGHEGARAFGTGCFKTHRTHDTRGMSESELKSLEHWKKFYAEHKTYFRVGRVSHPPIDPTSPIPEHCDPKKREAQQQPAQASTQNKQKKSSDHEEL